MTTLAKGGLSRRNKIHTPRSTFNDGPQPWLPCILADSSPVQTIKIEKRFSSGHHNNPFRFRNWTFDDS